MTFDRRQSLRFSSHGGPVQERRRRRLVNYRAGTWWSLALTFIVLTYAAAVWIVSDLFPVSPDVYAMDVYAISVTVMVGLWCVVAGLGGVTWAIVKDRARQNAFAQ